MNNIVLAILVLGILGIVFGLILAIASKVFAVKTDPRLPEIIDALPGANCGGCGYAGCSDCAAHILSGEAPVNACPVGGADSANKIAAILGVEATESEKMVAFVRCNGGTNAKKKFEYKGVTDCVGALKVGGGPLECTSGCLGMGTCVQACGFDAIHINDHGVAEVDRTKCTNCLKCAEACPQNLIISVPAKKPIIVPCNNKDKGVVAKNACDVSCIACRLCEKNCPTGAITVVDNVAQIDYSKCTNCGTCVTKCPRKLIIDLSGRVVPIPKKPAAPKKPAPKVTAPKAPEASPQTKAPAPKKAE